MTEQDTLTPISDQTNLIREKDDTSIAPTIFITLKLLPIILVLSTTMFSDSDYFIFICLFLSGFIILADFIATRTYFGKRLIGISWKFSCCKDSNFYVFDILPEPDMPSGSDINVFWIGITVPLIFWLVIPFFLLVNTNWFYFIVFFLLFILQVSNVVIFLKGNALASKQSAEAVRTVLLGNVDVFEELPEQATIESVSKQNSTASLITNTTEKKEEKEEITIQQQTENNQNDENDQHESKDENKEEA